MSNTFTCAQCGGTFEKEWTDEEAQAEAEETFGTDLVNPVLVCGDCYATMTEAVPIADFRRRLHAKEN